MADTAGNAAPARSPRTRPSAPMFALDPARVEYARRTTPGDLSAAGPLPALEAIASMLVPYLVLAIGLATLVAAVGAGIGARAFTAAGASGEASLGGAAIPLVGGHPSVVVFWLVWLIGGAWFATVVERRTRSVWMVLPAFIVGSTVFGMLGSGTIHGMIASTGLGLVDAEDAARAMANLPTRWWLPALVLGLGWIGARRDDGILLAAAVVTAMFTAWEMDIVRWPMWAAAVDELAVTTGDASRGAFRRTELVMHARALTDLLLLLAPIVVVRTLTDRTLGAIGASNWRAMRP